MSIFDMFRPAGQQPAPAPQPPAAPAPAPAAPVPSPANPGSHQMGNQAIPDPATGQPPAQNPLEQYNELFKAPAPPPAGAPAAPTQAVNWDQQQVAEAMNKMNFMAGAKPEDWAAVQAGGEGAVQAMQNIMNGAMRQMMVMQSGFAAQSANKAAEFAQQQFQSSVPEMVRAQLSQQALQTGNANVNHPALAPLVSVMTTQFQQQFPKATPQEIANHVQSYLRTVGEAFAPAPAPGADTKSAPAGQSDWGNWFGNQPPK